MIEILAGLVTFGATTVLTVAGVGAAFILIPLYMAMGIELQTAMSTALLLNGIAMILASVTFAREKLILWRLAIPLVVVATALSPWGPTPASSSLAPASCGSSFSSSFLPLP